MLSGINICKIVVVAPFQYRISVFFMLFMALLLAACSSNKLFIEPYSTYNVGPNYLNQANWAAHPAQISTADSLPTSYQNETKDSTVDVFFVHPTTFTNAQYVANMPITTQYWNAHLNDNQLNNQTDLSTILNQASAFNQYQVFAPRYRQAHMASFGLSDSLAKPLFDTAYNDVVSAFLIYLKHYNQGRPFVIAAHSQGTLHAARLIKELIENTPLQQKMVTAYLIGMPVPVDYFTTIKPCISPSQTGCAISWRTFKKGYIPQRVLAETKPMMVINPLSFDVNKANMPRQANLGSILFKYNKLKAHNVSAQVHGNVLWSGKPRFLGNIFFTKKNYHIGDINLFWQNIRVNVAERVAAYIMQTTR